MHERCRPDAHRAIPVTTRFSVGLLKCGSAGRQCTKRSRPCVPTRNCDPFARTKKTRLLDRIHRTTRASASGTGLPVVVTARRGPTSSFDYRPSTYCRVVSRSVAPGVLRNSPAPRTGPYGHALASSGVAIGGRANVRWSVAYVKPLIAPDEEFPGRAGMAAHRGEHLTDEERSVRAGNLGEGG